MSPSMHINKKFFIVCLSVVLKCHITFSYFSIPCIVSTCFLEIIEYKFLDWKIHFNWGSQSMAKIRILVVFAMCPEVSFMRIRDILKEAMMLFFMCWNSFWILIWNGPCLMGQQRIPHRGCCLLALGLRGDHRKPPQDLGQWQTTPRSRSGWPAKPDTPCSFLTLFSFRLTGPK